ncbi:9084_t:CDS:2 [Acaulospora morrowiae]|uniref:9084_t:CDS:1 n=1 Tax=Acaulospora morrowiae TaxID=94023 RepID=A0A9N8Z4N0_9GLOM|nr:9084_t:CDS:2 [Acaulospora morrowiae]
MREKTKVPSIIAFPAAGWIFGIVLQIQSTNDVTTYTRYQSTLKCKREESEVLSEIVKSAIREEFSRKKLAEMIQTSALSETKARNIIECYELKSFEISAEDFQPIEPIQYRPFLWDMENDEAHQMSEVEKWFKKALDLPRDFHVKDVHTRNYQRHLQTANVILTGGVVISIGPSNTPCVLIETKKKKENFKLGQVIGELLIMDKAYAPNPMSVVTDCNDNWIIYFFWGEENKDCYLASSIIDDRSVALAIIKQFVLAEGRTYLELLGKNITYQTDLPKPLTKRAKLLESIPEEVDDRMGDIIDDMTEKELFNMSMRRRLKLAKNIVGVEEHPAIDQLIRQFSDNYENPPSPIMFT